MDVGVSPEGEHTIIWLREVNPAFFAVHFFRGMNECQFSHTTKAHPHRYILIGRALGIEGRGIVMEWLPVTRITVPIEPGTNALFANVKVLA